MPSTPAVRPWGLTRATSFEEPNLDELPAVLSLDPHTQITTYRDVTGRIVHAGPPKHGTSRQTVTSEPTGGRDGRQGDTPDDARVVTYVPD